MKAWNRSCEFWVADDNSWWDQKTYVTSCSCVHRLWCADIIPCLFVPQWRPECDWQCSLYLQCVPEGYWEGWLHSDPRRCQWSGGEDVPHLGQSCGEYYFFISILINLPSDLFLQGKSFFSTPELCFKSHLQSPSCNAQFELKSTSSPLFLFL